MEKNYSSILVINEASKIGEQNSDEDDYLDMAQKNKGKKFIKFKKCKSKSSNIKNDETNLEGAENKVKSLLSLFLRNIEIEEKKDLVSDHLFLNEIETIKRIQRQNKFKTTKKINIYCDRKNSNILHTKEEFNKIDAKSSINLNYIRAHSHRSVINEKKNTIKNKRTTEKNLEKSNFHKNKRKHSLTKDSLSIDETVNFNSSSDIFAEQNNNNNFIKKTKTDNPLIGGKNNLKTIRPVRTNHTPITKNIKNSPIQKLCILKNENECSEIKLKKQMKNSFKIPNKIKNTASKNESKRDSILSNGSKTILKNLAELKNEIKIVDQLKDSSLGDKNLKGTDMTNSYVNKNKTNSILRTSNISENKKNNNSSISKRNSINASTYSNKNSLVGSLIKKKRHIVSNKGPRGIIRAITCSINKNKDLIKKDTNKLEATLKNLQEKIKQTIILRPEDLILDFSEGVKTLIKKEKTIVNKKKKEVKNSNLSSQSILPHLNKRNKLDVSKNYSNDIKKVEDIPVTQKKNEAQEELQEDVSQLKFIKLHEKHRIFTHRNKVYDSLDDEEIEEVVSDYIYFNPDSKVIMVVDAILLFFTLFSLYWIPFYLAHNLDFCKENKFKFTTVLNLFIEFMNFLDLFFGFFKAYYNFEEQLINNNSNIAKKYLSGWFIIDIISAIPFYSIFKFQEKKCNFLELSTKYYDNILHNLNYLYMCNRILKIIKLFFANKAYQYLSNNFQEKRPILKLIIYLIRVSCLLFVFHFCACLYIFIGRNSYPNWILYAKLEIKSFADIYVCAIYMLITTLTTVGYGDITCYSFHERLFQLILLIIGIMAYSYAVSSFSNYIQKINEKSIEYEKRKDILDDIKLSNPNLPDNLYDRILRYLKYKNLSEKMDKNIILDSLPVGLKNNLICEMYKPIIQNFIFFKNFENTDFIVKVILSFRPIIAIKNDILVNEGDIIEDIMFVKKGVLSVELPINIKNPYKNVEKYLNMTIFRIEKGPDLEKIGNSTIINSNINSTNILGKTVMTGEGFEKNLIETNKDNKMISDETTYVKILNIRENEHFGDVLTFMEKRSPLRVRVRSKKTELFFLRKTDAVKISSIYQNIWSRINKKSVFNFEQIKKSIHKIVEIYCAFKTIKTLSKNKETTKKRKAYRKTMRIGKHKLKLDQRARSKSEKIILKWKNKYFDDFVTETKLYRNNNVSQHSNKTLNLNLGSFSDDPDNDELEKEKYPYQKNSLNIKKKRSDSRLLNSYNGNYKLYKGTNNKYLNEICSILDEEQVNESTVTFLKKKEEKNFDKTLSKYNQNKILSVKHDFKGTSSIKQRFEKKSFSSKAHDEGNPNFNLDICSNNKKYTNEKKEKEEGEKNDGSSNNNNSENKKRKKIKGKEVKSSEKNKFNTEKIYSSRDLDKNNIRNESKISSSSSNKNENSSIINNVNDRNENNLTPFEKDDINDEIYSNEIFNITKKDENLFSRKIKLSYNLNQIQNNQDNLILNNKIIQLLLNSDSEISRNIQNNLNQVQIKNNKTKIINTNFNMSKETNENKISTRNCLHCKNHSKYKNYSQSKEKKTLSYSIIKNTEIEYKSLYENLNQVTNYKYSLNIELQNKVRNIITESSILTISNTNTLFKKQTLSTFNKSPILKSNEQKHIIMKNPLTNFKNISLYHVNSITDQKLIEFNNNVNKSNKNKKKNLLHKRSETFSDSPDTKKIRSTSVGSYKPEKNQFQTGVDNSFHNKNISFAGKFDIKKQKALRNKHEFEKQKINNNKNIILKKIKREKIDFHSVSGLLGGDIEQKNTLKMSPDFFNRNKKGSLLSQINLNIEKTNQNLNNPEEFYANYFNSILGGSGEQPKVDIKRCKRRGSAFC